MPEYTPRIGIITIPNCANCKPRKSRIFHGTCRTSTITRYDAIALTSRTTTGGRMK